MDFVYKYSVPRRMRPDPNSHRLADTPVPELVYEQLRLAHRMGNDLVRAQLDYWQARRKVYSTQPEIAAIEAKLEAAEATVAELVEQAKTEHSEDRTIATRQETATRLREAQAVVTDLRVQRRKACGKAAERGEVAAELAHLTATMRAATRADQAVVDLRRRYAAEGLHWGTYNAVIAWHATAVQEVEKARERGEAATLHFKRWEGTGTLKVQLAREHGNQCGCGGCIAFLMKKWRLENHDDTGTMVTLWHRDTPDQRRTLTDTAAADTVAQALNLPAGQVQCLRRKPRYGKPGTPYLALDEQTRTKPGNPKAPQRTPTLLAGLEDGPNPWRNQFALTPWMPPEQHAQLSWKRQRIPGTVRLGLGPDRVIQLPVTINRMIHPDADIREVKLTVTRVAGKPRMSISVSCNLPDPQPKHTGPTIAVHLGWRQLDDSTIRVATWRSTEPVELPDKLRDVVTINTEGTAGEIHAPEMLVSLATRPNNLQSLRDDNLAPVAAAVAEWLDDHPQPDPRPDDPDRILTGAVVRRWHAADRWARLTRQWTETPPAGEGADNICAMLRSWAFDDRHLWQWQVGTRRKMQDHRDDRWRNIAKWLATTAARVVVDKTNLAKIAKRQRPDDSDPTLPGHTQQRARARARLVAPGELRSTIEITAAREGATVEKVESANLSRTCPHCGKVGKPDPRYAAAATVTCPSCDRTYDQDTAATALMLTRAAAARATT